MIFLKNEMYRQHWDMLATMLEEVYGHLEEPDSCIVLGNYIFNAAHKIKKQLNAKKLIIYQSEPLIENHWWSPSQIIKNLEGADEVWDYDLENINFLKNHGIDAKFRPPAYSEKLKRVVNIANPDIDILFYGTPNPYRNNIIYSLTRDPVIPEKYLSTFKNLNIVTLYNVLGDKLDEYIARSKIILNLNPYEGECRQQQTRIFYGLINNKCVLSERNKINYYGNQITQFKGLEELFDKSMSLLRDDKWREFTNNNYKENSYKMILEGERILSIDNEKKQSSTIASSTMKPAKICMISMFKNESKNIRTMLESVAPYISYWVLQDNGSTDGTPDIVKEWAAETNIPGHLYKVDEGWVGFGWNRDHLLQTTQKLNHGCDWIMKMDCDETLEVDSNFDWTPFSENHQSFHVTSVCPGLIYLRAWIWRAGLPWKFNHDPAHETIYLDDGEHGANFKRFNLSKSFRMRAGQKQGESYSVPTKYVTDALKLEEKLIRENTMLSDVYHFWYIGKSYEDCYRGNYFPLKETHQKEYARRCIFYFENVIKHTHDGKLKAQRIDEMAYYAMCAIGNAHRYLKEYEKAIECYTLAQDFCPRRNDHILYLAEIYWEMRNFRKMFLFTQILTESTRTNPFPDYYFLINPNMYIDGDDNGRYIKSLHELALNQINNFKSTDAALTVNQNSKKRIFVVDDFYSDPHFVRRVALDQEFNADINWYKGKRSAEKYLTEEIKQKFEQLMGIKITNWEHHGMNGRFQYCTPEDLLVYHHDAQTWAGIVYLTPDAPFDTGTCLLAHKATKARHAEDPGIAEAFNGGFYDSTKFEVVDVVGNVFNRLIIFDAKCIHAASKYFGQTVKDSRLFHLFFFD